LRLNVKKSTIWDDSSDGFDKCGIKILASKKYFAYSSVSNEFFQEEVVGGSGIIVAIGFDAFFSEVILET